MIANPSGTRAWCWLRAETTVLQSRQEKCDKTQVEDALNLRAGKCNGPEILRN